MLFSVADAVLLRPFPFAHADRLVIAGENLIEPRSEITYRDFLAWRSGATAFDDLAAIGSANWSWRLRTPDEQVEVRYRAVSGNFFDLVGARALFGRALRGSDDRADAARVVVLSHGFWQRQLGGDPAAVGRSIVLGGTSFAIVGVMSPEFRYPAAPDVWTPIVPEFASIAAGVPGTPADLGDAGVCYAIGRLKPQATVTAAQLDLNRVIQAHTRQGFRQRAVESRVTAVTDEILGSNRMRLLSLSLAAGVLLLIACANIAGLMLVRASGRGREFAVRLALGASPAALARQLLFEGVWLSLGATIAAIVAAYALLPVVVAMLPADVPRIGDAALNGRAIVFACVIGMLTAVLSAIAPAIRMARVDLEPILRKGGHTVGGGLRHPFRRALIVAELAAAVVLTTAVGLLARSVAQVRHLDIGFNPRNLVAIEMSMPAERMKDADARALLASAADALARLPGVASVSSVSQRPLQGPIGLDSPYEAEGQTPEQARKNPYVNTETISASYFDTMQTPLVAGRAFDESDRAETTRVLIVSRRFAELVWPGQTALGRRLRVAALDRTEPPTRAWWTIVGVAADIRYRTLASPGITLYAPIAQSPDRANQFVLRSSAPAAMVIGPIRSRLQTMNGNGSVTIALMEQVLRTLEAPWRANLALFGAFAGLSVVLAVIGLYGMLAYAVATERREIGVRLVLGATPGRIARDVVMDGARIIALGSVAGAVAAAVLLRLMASILFEVSPADPLTLAAAPILFAVVALIVCALPAVRASRTEPAICLRAE
jgi:putative ABC transport system permease protein